MDTVITYARSLDAIPNTPYLTGGVSRAMIELLSKLSNICVAEDDTAVYAHYRYGNPAFAIMFDSHLDHPGFVFRNSTEAIEIGSIFPTQPDASYTQPLYGQPMLIADQSGKILGECRPEAVDMSQDTARLLVNSQNIVTRRNHQVIPKLPFHIQKEQLLMRSADNHAVTAVLLALAENLSKRGVVGDITFTFPKLEEVRQASATRIAARRETPFAKIDHQTLIIVMEAGMMGGNKKTALITKERGQYNKGPVIRIGDDDLAFQLFGQLNMAESLMLHAADSGKIRVQHAPSIAHSDATAYILSGELPHVIGITVPCVNKHNTDGSSGFLHEQVAISDLRDAMVLLTNAIYLAAEGFGPHPEAILSGNRQFAANAPAMLARRAALWQETARWALPRLKMGKLFPENPRDYAQLVVGNFYR
jgi:M42 glutamyl aminopeptidase